MISPALRARSKKKPIESRTNLDAYATQEVKGEGVRAGVNNPRVRHPQPNAPTTRPAHYKYRQYRTVA